MELIRSQLNHYEDLFGTRIILDGSDILLRPEAAQNIGIALHELSTNAAKYGALSNQTGQVDDRLGLHRRAAAPICDELARDRRPARRRADAKKASGRS